MRCKDENKQENIFSATIQLINEIGFAETSMSKIATRAGVSASTLYVYFENKEDMINKLYLTVKKQMSEKIFRTRDGSLSIQAEFEKILRTFIDFIIHEKDCFLFIEQFSNSPLLQKLSREQAKGFFRPMCDLFDRGKEEKILKPVSANLLAMYAFSPVTQFAKEYHGKEFKITETDIGTLIQMSWDAIKA